MVLVDEEKIVNVPSHLPRRHDAPMDVELGPVRERRKQLRDHAHLNVMGHPELTFDALLGCRGLLQTLV
jgi:hypothetical protein